MLNAQNDAITFTKEDENEGKLPFLDGEIARKHARLTLTVNRKPTHSGRYLNFASLHPISAKCSTADSLFNRAESIVTEEEQKEEEYRKATQELLANDYPPRFIARRLELAKSRTRQAQTPSLTSDRDRKKLTTVVMPFVDGVSQPIRIGYRPRWRSDIWRTDRGVAEVRSPDIRPATEDDIRHNAPGLLETVDQLLRAKVRRKLLNQDKPARLASYALQQHKAKSARLAASNSEFSSLLAVLRRSRWVRAVEQA